ncbi:MAG TPA: peptidylprolyl isomerase [Pirellulales bacterium]|nr:peptidylprolyl isomerase [Pirellulales bacterium]
MRKPTRLMDAGDVKARNRRPRKRAAKKPAEPLRLESLEDRVPLSADPIVTVNTDFGAFKIELFQSVAPQTVANFLSYVNSGAYNDSIFHRTVPGFVLQGGGFTSPTATFTNTSQFSTITTHGNVPNEFHLSNTIGTIAMAKLGSNPNSATDQWFVNLGNNSSNLDNQNGGFTVFGQVLGNGMQIVNEIAAFPTPSSLSSDPTFNQLPVGPNNQLGLMTSLVEDGVKGTVFSAPAGDTNVNDRHPLAGVTVFIDANNSGVLSNSDVSATTDANGQYFLNAETGTYHVRVQPPAGFQATTPAGGASDVTLSTGSPQAVQDFGFQAVAPTGVTLLTVTGTVNTTGFTNQNNSAGHTLTFQVGGAANGALVKVFDGQTLIGQATANSSTVNVTTDGTTLLADGPHSITASQVVAGVATAASPALGITVDTVPPAFDSKAPSGQIEAGTSFSYTAHAGDAGSSVAYSLVTAPGGMSINGQTGLVSWLPNASQAGSQAVDVRATDLAGNTADQTFTILVHDTPPVLAPIASVTIDETQTLQFTVQATDINLPADTLFFTLGGGSPAGAAIDRATGALVWSPGDTVPSGTYPFKVIVTDAAGKSDSQSFNVTVTEPNEAPTLAPIATQTAAPGQTLSFHVQAGGDGDEPPSQFTYSLDPGAPAGATIDANGHFTWTVPNNTPQTSIFHITVRVTGGGASSLSAIDAFEVVLGNPADLLFTSKPLGNSLSGGPGSVVGPALQALFLAGHRNPTVQNVLLPYDYFQEAPTPNGLSGIFTETGLPHAYEDEELLAGRKITANKPTGDAPNNDQPGNSQPGDAPPGDAQPNGPSDKPADGDRPHQDDQGAWWGPEGELQPRVERLSPPDDDEVLAMNAIAEHILGLCAPDRAAIDEALADDDTIDAYDAMIDDAGRKPAPAGVPSAAAVSVLLPFTAQAVPRRRPARPIHWQRRLERLQRC